MLFRSPVYVLGDARAIPRNFRHAVINDEHIQWFDNGRNYRDVVSAAVDEATDRHAFVTESEEAPDSVHPSLWRQARLNKHHGLFEVAEGVWQVRSYDLANITFMSSDEGWLIIDTPRAFAAMGVDLFARARAQAGLP